MVWKIEPLVGQHVTLQPLTEAHFEPLWAVAQHASIWRYMPFAAATFEQFADYLRGTLAQVERGETMAFVTQLNATGEAVGATSFLALSEAHRRLEIGATWITPAQQRSVVNTEAKLLQLTHAFERFQCNRVELKTDSLNDRSQQAILRLGATEEGTFRNHMIMPDGRLRHTVWFSITADEWPAVKASLQARLKR